MFTDATGFGPGVWMGLGAVWVGAASLSGLVVAILVRRIHPRVSLYRLWVFYSFLTAFLVAVVFLVGIF